MICVVAICITNRTLVTAKSDIIIIYFLQDIILANEALFSSSSIWLGDTTIQFRAIHHCDLFIISGPYLRLILRELHNFESHAAQMEPMWQP